MKRYLIFNEQSTAASVGDAAHDTACWPLDRFLGFTNLAGHATNQDIDMLFRSLSVITVRFIFYSLFFLFYLVFNSFNSYYS